jgi:hypothetical protein
MTGSVCGSGVTISGVGFGPAGSSGGSAAATISFVGLGTIGACALNQSRSDTMSRRKRVTMTVVPSTSPISMILSLPSASKRVRSVRTSRPSLLAASSMK